MLPILSPIIKIYKKILIKRPNKRNHILVKLYQVINSLNYLKKVVKKLVAKKLSQFYKAKKNFIKGR